MITGLLLAAGASRRFGAQKLLQVLDGKPLVRWSAELLVGDPIGEIVVVVPPDHQGIRDALRGIDARYLVNPHAERGMGGSIACGVAGLQAGTDAVLVALADEPLASRSVLEQVVERYRAGGASIVVPTFGSERVRGHPVVFDRSVFEELRRLSGDTGARAITDRDPSRLAIVHVEQSKTPDVDVPADLARLNARASEASRPLIERFLPTYDVRASYGVDVPAPVDVVYRAVLDTDLARSIVARVLMTLRSLGASARDGRSLRIGELPSRGGFFELGRDAPHEIVIGVVGTFWALRGNVCESDRNTFAGPLDAGTAKAAWNFRVEATAHGSRLTTETRVLCADTVSRRRFRRYWMLVGPFSGLIRLDALRLIRRHAQFMSPASHSSTG